LAAAKAVPAAAIVDVSGFIPKSGAQFPAKPPHNRLMR
jgi:hypothetical protein